MKRLLPLAVLLAAFTASATTAEADCRCRGSDGRLFEQGELACIKTAKGPRLARCGMVLNNSSWSVVGDDCPTAMATPVPDRIAVTWMAATISPPFAAPYHRDVP